MHESYMYCVMGTKFEELYDTLCSVWASLFSVIIKSCELYYTTLFLSYRSELVISIQLQNNGILHL